MKTLLSEAISEFGIQVARKFQSRSIKGAPEDHLRSPFEKLMSDMATAVGVPALQVVSVGEPSLVSLKTRPDYSIDVRNALVGFVELKSPGKGADPRAFTDAHDCEQWGKLKSLPNIMYCDGNEFSLWRSGELVRNIVRLIGDVTIAGKGLRAPNDLLGLFSDFLNWAPIAPRSASALAAVTAKLCRLLRDETLEQLGLGDPALVGLADDWRRILLAEATNSEFADGYAQAITFGLLLAKANGISLNGDLDQIAKQLTTESTIIGEAFRILIQSTDNEKTLRTSLGTLTRVLEAVDWAIIDQGDPDTWLYFYEDFLNVYDKNLRRLTGSYYTPLSVVESMTRLVDDALHDPLLFDIHDGIASAKVKLADPAMGTGTYIIGLLRAIAKNVEMVEGPGAIPGAVKNALKRLVGFEIQLGPFAVAQLRVLAEIAHLTHATSQIKVSISPRLFITNTLSNPFSEDNWLPQTYKKLSESRRLADAVKKTEPVTVIIGNPPYKDKAKGKGGWIEKGEHDGDAPLNRWVPPSSWGLGVHTKHLKNQYVYFWRWATWKVFGDSSNAPQTSPEQKGIVCFITAAGFLGGRGFEAMRADLRRKCDHIWVIDCTPEGHQPPIQSRLFGGVQQPICIVLAARSQPNQPDKPAEVRYTALPKGPKEIKMKSLASLSLTEPGWRKVSQEWRSSFFPAAEGAWAKYVKIDDIFVSSCSGVMPGRTWVVAPDQESLHNRWKILQNAKPEEMSDLFHPHLVNGRPGDRHPDRVIHQGLKGHEHRSIAVSKDHDAMILPIPYTYRSFDRQWIIPDVRLLNRPNPSLWESHSERQVYLTAFMTTAPSSGPAATFCSHIPDIGHYKGSGGGRVFSLWLDDACTVSNIHPAFMEMYGNLFRKTISPEDVMCYVAGLVSHPFYIDTFKNFLVDPGLRVPLTAEKSLFESTALLGREIIWLHTFGERFYTELGNKKGLPRQPTERRPSIPSKGAIPLTNVGMPDRLQYDLEKRRLLVGQGFIENVEPEVWEYQICGVRTLEKWFSYRRKSRAKTIIGDRRPPSKLDLVGPSHWLPEYTSDLLNVLNVLSGVVLLQKRQEDALKQVCAGPLLDSQSYTALRIKGRAVKRQVRVRGRRSSTSQEKLSLKSHNRS